MKIVDAIKNALFEVEYVEVKNDEGKEKDKQNKNDKSIDKPIAKKVILSNPKKDRNKETREIREDKNVENFDSRAAETQTQDDISIEPPIVSAEEKHPAFKVMNDNDFKVEEEYPTNREESRYETESYEQDKYYSAYNNATPKVEERVIYRQEVHEKAPYGIDESSKSLVQEYGKAYEKKETKTGFKPSPIISPIYGVLDKNYKKEDVKEKKEVHLKSYSTYSNNKDNVTVDDVRNKAYGIVEKKRQEVLEEENNKVMFEEEDDDEDDDNLLVDLSKDGDKPSVKEITMGDALEYFQDLGLEYNVDYVDASKEKATGRRVKDNYDEKPELFEINKNEDSINKKRHEEEILEEEKKDKEDKLDDKFNDSSDKKEDSVDVENDDNLFDLIDSMYVEK